MLSTTPIAMLPADLVRPNPIVGRQSPRPNPLGSAAPAIFFPNPRTLIAFTLTFVLSIVLGVNAAQAADGTPVVNVNTADAAELALLPRVGPALSQRIVEFREENGKFGEPAELMLVQGIGERTFELLEAYLVVEGETTLETKVRTQDAQARLEARQADDKDDD